MRPGTVLCLAGMLLNQQDTYHKLQKKGELMKMKKLWFVIVLFMVLCFSGCSRGPYELTNSPESIATIQLCKSKGEPGVRTYPEDVKVIRQLEEDEIDAFIQDICQLEMHLTNPPARGFGTNIVVITYSDGGMDILSDHAVVYAPAGEKPGQVSGRTFSKEPFNAVFSKYADKE